MHALCGRRLYQLWIGTHDARGLECKRLIRADAAVNDMVQSELAALDDLDDPVDEVLNIRRASPDIRDGTDALSRAQAPMDCADERFFAGAENPRAADDE